MQAVTGNTPLHMAVLHGDAKMTSQMVAALQENGGNVDIPNSNGDTVRCTTHAMLCYSRAERQKLSISAGFRLALSFQVCKKGLSACLNYSKV